MLNAFLRRQYSPERPRGQSLGTAGCGSSDVEASTDTTASGLSPRTHETPPFSGLMTRCRSHRKAAHELVHDYNESDSNGDSDSKGSEDDLDRTNLLQDEDYCPSLTAGEERGQEGEISDEEEQCPRKRRRVSGSPTDSICHAAARVERPRRGCTSTGPTTKSTKEKCSREG